MKPFLSLVRSFKHGSKSFLHSSIICPYKESFNIFKMTNLPENGRNFSNIAKQTQSPLQTNKAYTIEEISVPNGHQYGYQIGCKVWRGSESDTEPPIICVHGWLDNANSFDALIPKLIRSGRTFYAFDLPGHGRSSHIHTTHYNGHIEAHLAIHRVVRHLQLDKFTLMGHSMGAEGAVMYAATFPEGVHKVITIDGVNPKPPDWVQSVKLFVTSLFEVEETLAKSLQANPVPYEEILGRITKAREGMVTEEGCKLLLKRGAQKVPGTENKYRFTHDLKLKMLPGMAMLTTDQMSEFCAAVTVPLCVIKAEEHDFFSEQASKDFQTAMDKAKDRNKDLNVEFHVVKGNHHVHLNTPNEVVPIINKFLES